MTDTIWDPEDEQDGNANRRITAQLLAEAGWDRIDRDPFADCDRGLKRFAQAAIDLRDALNSSEARLETVRDLIALTEMRTKSWWRYVDPALSARDRKGRPIVVLYECAEHQIAVRFGASQWIVRRGDQILQDAEDFEDETLEAQTSEFEPEVFDLAAVADTELHEDDQPVVKSQAIIDAANEEVSRLLEENRRLSRRIVDLEVRLRVSEDDRTDTQHLLGQRTAEQERLRVLLAEERAKVRHLTEFRRAVMDEMPSVVAGWLSETDKRSAE